MNLLAAALAAPDKTPSIDVAATIKNLGGLAAAVLALVLVVIAIRTAWKNHKEGDVSGSFSTLMVVFICVTIAALGATAGLALGYGGAALTALQKIVS